MIVPIFVTLIAAIVWRLCCPRQWLSIAIIGVVALGCLPHSVLAQEAAGDVFTALADYSTTTDSNLFRRPDSANPRSDVINSATGTLRFDKTYSQQNFQLEVTEALKRYDKSSYLNFNATNYRGAWSWSSSPWFNASFSADRSKSLAQFEDTLSTQRNVTIHESRALNLDGRISGNWNWQAGVSRSDQKSQQAIVNQPDQRTDGVQAGIEYVTPSGNSITFTQRASKGDYQNQSAIPGVTGKRFKEETSELKEKWKLSEKSEFTALIAHNRRRNNQVGQRDFSGVSSDIGYAWQPTSKLSLTLAVNHKIAPLQDQFFSHTEDHSFSITPSWQITQKVKVLLLLSHAKSAYRGRVATPIVTTVVPQARRDTTDNAQFTYEWNPLRELSIRVILQKQRRTSNSALAEYDDNISTINATWKF